MEYGVHCIIIDSCRHFSILCPVISFNPRKVLQVSGRDTNIRILSDRVLLKRMHLGKEHPLNSDQHQLLNGVFQLRIL